MSDQFHQSIQTIYKILKSSPLTISIKNIQRLSNYYKFESFIESFQDFKRLSIAGKILVIDIDFYEGDDTSKQQLIRDAKLILANNNNDFTIQNELKENIILNSLTKYENLNKFDSILEKLNLMDQFSSNIDLYEYYIFSYRSLKEKLHVNLNNDDEFKILINNRYVWELIENDGGAIVKDELTTDDISIKLSFDKIVVPESYLIQNSLQFNKVENVQIFNSNDVYTQNDVKFSGIQFVNDLIEVDAIFAKNLESIVKIIEILEIFTKINEFITIVKTQFQVLKEDDIVETDELFKQFTSSETVSITNNSKFISITLYNNSINLNISNRDVNDVKFEDPELVNKLTELKEKILSEIT